MLSVQVLTSPTVILAKAGIQEKRHGFLMKELQYPRSSRGQGIPSSGMTPKQKLAHCLRMKNSIKKNISILLCCLITGCTLFPEGEAPPPVYTLKSEPFTPTTEQIVPLAIDLPHCEASLNTNRIAITLLPYQREYIADGQWPDRLPKVIQEVFLESFSSRWGGVYVNRNESDLQTTYSLYSEIQDFSLYHIEKGCPEVCLKIMIKLVDFRNKNALAAHVFSEKVPASSATMLGIMTAFNEGLHKLLRKATPWIEKTIMEQRREHR